MKNRSRPKLLKPPPKSAAVLRADPTRTTALRGAFASSLGAAFAAVAKTVSRVVGDEDAFGLKSQPTTNADTTHEFASTHFVIDDLEILRAVKEMQDRLDPADVVKLEDRPHVTVRYGLHDDPSNPLRVENIVKHSGAVFASTGPLSLFTSVANAREVEIVANVFCATGEGGGVDPTCGVNEKRPIPPATADNIEMIAGTLRDALDETVGNPKDQCIACAYAVKQLYPQAEIYSGAYFGEPHTLAKLGGKFIDVTADQFDASPKVQTLDPDRPLPQGYRRFMPDAPRDPAKPQWETQFAIAKRFRELLEMDAEAMRQLSTNAEPKPDVLKVTVVGWKLHDLNRKLKAVEHTDTFPEYRPHMTVAYLKPGTGQKYFRLQQFLPPGTPLRFTKMAYSDANRNETDVTLNVFCATGEGGGVDPTCSNGSGVITDKHGVSYQVVHTSHQQKADERYEPAAFAAGVVYTRHRYGIKTADGKRVGEVELARKGKSVMHVAVDPEFQRRGIATAVYAHIEKHLGVNLEENATTDDGEKFWASRRLRGLTGNTRWSGHTSNSRWASQPPSQILNVFCATGSGGGVDPSCSSGSGSMGPDWSMSGTRKYEWKEDGVSVGDVKVIDKGDGVFRTEQLGVVRSARGRGVAKLMYKSLFHHMAKEGALEIISGGTQSPGGHAVWESLLKDGLPIKKVGKGYSIKLADLPPTTNTRWSGQPPSQKVNSFGAWLNQLVAQTVTGPKARNAWDVYLKTGFKRGVTSSYTDVAKADRASVKKTATTLGWYSGAKDQFVQSAMSNPLTADKVKMLANQTFDHLTDVTSTMSTRISRVLTDGLIKGLSPKAVASNIVTEVGLAKQRALVIVQTELIRAHAEGQLTALEAAGVEQVSAAAEYDTTGDGKVCPKCRPLDGVVLTVPEARGMIPRHPRCRCSWKPAVVKQPGMITGAGAIKKAMKQADAEPNSPIAKARPELMSLNQLTAPFSDLLTWNSDPLAKHLLGLLTVVEPVFNYFDPSQPRDAKGRWGTGGFRHDVSTPMSHLAQLGGSTGATLVSIDGKKWVKKSGGGAKGDHIESEHHATKAYQAVGADVPGSSLHKANDAAENVSKLSRYVTGGQTYAEFKQTATPDDLAKMKKEAGRHFAMDALLGNWDVVGMSGDNMIIKNSRVYRIDNGGALKYRAQGQLKTPEQFGPSVPELHTMRDPSKNQMAAEVFGHLTDAQVAHQMRKIVKDKDKILAAIPEAYGKGTIEQRISTFKTLLQVGFGKTPTVPVTQKVKSQPVPDIPPFVPTPKLPTSQEIPPATTAHHLHSADGLESYVKSKKSAGPAVTDLYMKKLKYLNPNGTKDGEVILPWGSGTPTHLEMFKKILPAGTVIKKHDVFGKDLEAGTPFQKKAKAKVLDTAAGGDQAGQVPAPPPAPKVVPPPTPPTKATQPQPVHAEVGQFGLDETKSQVLKKVAEGLGTLKDKPFGPVHAKNIQSGLKEQAVYMSLHDVAEGLKSQGFTVKPNAVFDKTTPAPEPGRLTKEQKKANLATNTSVVENPDGTRTTTYYGHTFTQSPKVITTDQLKEQAPNIPGSGSDVHLPNNHVWDKKEHKDWVKNLTPEQASIISSWKGSSGSVRRHVAKHAGDGTAATDPKTTALMSALASQPPQPGVYYRGVSGAYANNFVETAKKVMESGRGWVADQLPHGLSGNSGTSVGFAAGHTFLRIVSKSARPIVNAPGGYASEAELIVPPLTRYRVKAVHDWVKVNGSKLKHVIELEEI